MSQSLSDSFVWAKIHILRINAAHVSQEFKPEWQEVLVKMHIFVSDIKTCNDTKDFYLKQMLFFWTLYSSKNPKSNIKSSKLCSKK